GRRRALRADDGARYRAAGGLPRHRHVASEPADGAGRLTRYTRPKDSTSAFAGGGEDMAATDQAARGRRVIRKIRGQPTSDGAGVRMTRVIGTQAFDHFDPFLLLDEFRSDDPNDYIAGFPNHP